VTINHLRFIVKGVCRILSITVATPFGLLAGFGRFRGPFRLFAQAFALIPGVPGDWLRVGYYVLTLRRCSLDLRVSFGSYFAHSSSAVDDSVYIGAYCIIGTCNIGARTQIASHVEILSGRYQHSRDAEGRVTGPHQEDLVPLNIGEDCWIGARALVMADVGAQTTVGAGAVVTRSIPDGVVAVGNPARVLEPSERFATAVVTAGGIVC
jgi:virginiamycin A acetyltransferase